MHYLAIEIHTLGPVPPPTPNIHTHTHMKPNIFKKKSIFPVNPMKIYRGSRGIAPLILI
jgi:hypothetical protein